MGSSLVPYSRSLRPRPGTDSFSGSRETGSTLNRCLVVGVTAVAGRVQVARAELARVLRQFSLEELVCGDVGRGKAFDFFEGGHEQFCLLLFPINRRLNS